MKKVLILLALAASMLFCAARAGASIMVSFDPAATSISAGSSFNVDVYAQVPQNEGLVGWGFSLIFDDTQVALKSVLAGPLWDLVYGPTATTPVDPLAALLSPTAVSPPDGASGSSVLLATISLLCVSPGTSLFDISVADPAVDPNQGFMTAAGNYAAWSSVGANITQTPGRIPEPAGLLLFLAALGAAWIGRRGMAPR